MNRSLILLAAALLAAPLAAQDDDDRNVLAKALASVSPEVRKFHEHVVWLSSPYMDGRIPGSRGMELAREYCEHHLKVLGLDAPFSTDGVKSFRQAFPLGSVREVSTASVTGPVDFAAAEKIPSFGGVAV